LHTGKFGWYAQISGPALPENRQAYEQIVSSPSLFQQSLIVNSTIPATNSPLSCTTSGNTGNTYVISVVSGAARSPKQERRPGTSGFVNHTDTNMVGLQTNENGASEPW